MSTSINGKSGAEYHTEEELTEYVRIELEGIKSGEIEESRYGGTPQAIFCENYEARKALGAEDPAYELMHRLCKELFGATYNDLIKIKKAK